MDHHLAVVEQYRELLENVNASRFSDDAEPEPLEAHAHAKWMLDKIEEFVAEDKLGKANRWLGFVQGIFYSFGTYTINQMRDHNRGTECSE
ncbi:hypothetical protein LCGC14_0244720 [marine sediment metagenome]|uniref:Uncharacterized protein n=1 Tax=marine sediment metagenome TaxID=412755 RepID=A0A0F9U6N7_9ZZZZ